MMRLVCMVPSITETLLDCGLNVVGRTRFCIHPKEATDSIAIVGGTKDISWDKVKALQPDLLILDQEENPKKFADEAPCPCWSSHIEDLSSVPRDLLKLQELLLVSKNSKGESFHYKDEHLKNLIKQWQAVLQQPLKTKPSWSKFPGLVEWLKQPEDKWQAKEILYVIWKDPWIVVSKNTFIGSMLKHFKMELPTFANKYPKIKLTNYDPKTTLLLFSTEPYPFTEHKEELKSLPYHSALIDGEKFSWFGVRSLKFLKESIESF